MVNSDVMSALASRWPENKINPSLDRIKLLLDYLGNPQDGLKAIHIAGTNGKTSTSRMIERLLRSLDLRTGLYTSPHLVHPRERISIDGEPISVKNFEEVFKQVEPFLEIVDEKIPGGSVTFFEVLTAMAFVSFSDTPVDVISLEVGMGGRWDATNVLTPMVSVITPIDLDHQEYLGNTVEKIALEKTGIIKENIPVIVSNQSKDAAKIILAKAIENNSPIMREGIELDVLERSVGIGGQQLTIANPYGTHSELFLPLFGKHQASNAAVSLTAVEAFLDRQIDHDLVQEAFAEFSSPGRLQVLKRNPTIVIDAAHNPAGIKATKQGITESFQFDNLILILAFMGDKDVNQILEELKGFAQVVILTQTNSARALSVVDLAKKVKNISQFATRIESSDNSSEAIKLAIDIAKDLGNSAGIIVLGSVVLAGEIGLLIKGGLNK
ncbi:MAG: bifunctional folylpolyglutamate synthase/dihydrofolate synthase [Candidatus Nanopelagicales bacterium]|nr:bifunctional folylpolyglutamate synthase/dihydrofolate synthase [Candidatus Nanopelagicales bacterium]